MASSTQAADACSVAEAREAYFAANGFSTASYSDKWVKLKLGPLPIAFPNSPSRQKAVPLHDLHHVATGYATTFTGEGEIGAWEIGAGCGRYWAAWYLNLTAFGMGMWIAPRKMFHAFVRGRRSRSLYDRAMGNDLLALRVGELRERLGLSAADADAHPASGAEWTAFVLWIGAMFGNLALSLSPFVLMAWWIWG
jgi:hypothetical protein